MRGAPTPDPIPHRDHHGRDECERLTNAVRLMARAIRQRLWDWTTWRADPAVSSLSPDARCCWLEWVGCMAEDDDSGELTGTVELLACWARVSADLAARAIDEVAAQDVADVTRSGNGRVTLICRSMKRRTDHLANRRENRGKSAPTDLLENVAGDPCNASAPQSVTLCGSAVVPPSPSPSHTLPPLPLPPPSLLRKLPPRSKIDRRRLPPLPNPLRGQLRRTPLPPRRPFRRVWPRRRARRRRQSTRPAPTERRSSPCSRASRRRTAGAAGSRSPPARSASGQERSPPSTCSPSAAAPSRGSTDTRGTDAPPTLYPAGSSRRGSDGSSTPSPHVRPITRR